MKKITYINDIQKIVQLKPEERLELKEVQQKYAFRVNDYYLTLINWDDPYDPIRQLVIPQVDELINWGKLDASNEQAYTPVPGMQHKYRDTALLLLTKTCGGFCRYCFRKRLFMKNEMESSTDITAGLDYIRKHPDFTNVLLTGGDPLILSTERLRDIIEKIFEIEHVRIIRIGTKMVAFNPRRILDDSDFLNLLSSSTKLNKKIYIMHHFIHPRELTVYARRALDLLNRTGVISTNQCPLIKGVNDNPKTLAELFSELSFIGCPPYYLFQGRPTVGNAPYRVPIMEGFRIFHDANRLVSGLAKRGRYVMSHVTGKIEIMWVDGEKIILRYHRAIKAEDYGRIMIFGANKDAFWLNDLEPIDDRLAKLKDEPYGPE